MYVWMYESNSRSIIVIINFFKYIFGVLLFITYYLYIITQTTGWDLSLKHNIIDRVGGYTMLIVDNALYLVESSFNSFKRNLEYLINKKTKFLTRSQKSLFCQDKWQLIFFICPRFADSFRTGRLKEKHTFRLLPVCWQFVKTIFWLFRRNIMLLVDKIPYSMFERNLSLKTNIVLQNI